MQIPCGERCTGMRCEEGLGKGKKGPRAGEWLQQMATLLGGGFRGLVGGSKRLMLWLGEGAVKDWLWE